MSQKQYKFITPVILISPSGAERKVLADVASVKQSEFYAAKQANMKVEAILNVRSFEYASETKCKYSGKSKIYTIYRSYNVGNGITELYLNEKKGEQV